MAHYAQLDQNNIVVNVIYVDNQFILGDDGNELEELAFAKVMEGLNDPNARIVKTSCNNNIRVRYAGIGYSYDEEYDAFIKPKPHPSWILNADTLDWEAPTLKPNDTEDGVYVWNEDSVDWVFEQLPSKEITEEGFRSQLTLTEKLFWDNPDNIETPSQKAVMVTFKQELPLIIGEQETTELLNILVSAGVFTQQRLDEIISAI